MEGITKPTQDYIMHEVHVKVLILLEWKFNHPTINHWTCVYDT